MGRTRRTLYIPEPVLHKAFGLDSSPEEEPLDTAVVD